MLDSCSGKLVYMYQLQATPYCTITAVTYIRNMRSYFSSHLSFLPLSLQPQTPLPFILVFYKDKLDNLY